MSDATVQYQYKELDTSTPSVRVLRILSQRANGTIVCSLTNVQLSIASYTALSYMWGPNRPAYELKAATTEKHIILVDQTEIEVGQNLWHFLRAVQISDLVTDLWVDALCIDQNNAEERNKQVSMMGQIYLRAENVIMWLGPGSNATRVFFNLLPNLEHAGLANGITMTVRNTTDELHQFMTGFHEVSTNQYWHRAWILQEVSLAKDVLIKYGTDEMPWNLFRKLFRSLFKELNLELEPLFQQVGLERYTRLDRKAVFEVMQCRSDRYRQREVLCNIVRWNFSRQCKLVQDRIYSLLSLASDGSAIEVNYNWAPAQLWEHVAGMIGNGIFRRGVYLLNTLEVSTEDVLKTASQDFLGHRLQIKINIDEIQYVVQSGGMAARNYWNDSKTAYVTESELYMCSCLSCKCKKSMLSEELVIVRLPGGIFKLLFEEDKSMSSHRVFKPIGCIVDSLEGSINPTKDYIPDSIKTKGFDVVAIDTELISHIEGLSITGPKLRTECPDQMRKGSDLVLHLTRRDLVNIWNHRRYDRDLLSDAQFGFGEWKHNARWDASVEVSFFAVTYDYDSTFTQATNPAPAA